MELPRTFIEHVLSIAVDSRRHTVYAVQQKNASVVVIDTRACNGTRRGGCSTLEPRSVHTGPNPQGMSLDKRTHTLYVSNQVGDSLSVIDAATCNAEVSAGASILSSASLSNLMAVLPLFRRDAGACRTIRSMSGLCDGGLRLVNRTAPARPADPWRRRALAREGEGWPAAAAVAPP